jgi:hypothetical protein
MTAKYARRDTYKRPACRGTGAAIARIALEERGRSSEGTKEYRCPDCGRWLRPSSLETLPYHCKTKDGR